MTATSHATKSTKHGAIAHPMEQDVRTPPPRYAGVLLHPTSLPGPHGIGDLGAEAFAFVDWLVKARQSRWQILPLGPTGYGDSPYQSFSTFAGNPLLISLEELEGDGLLGTADLTGAAFPDDHVDYNAVTEWKAARLTLAAERFHTGRAGQQLRPEYEQFCHAQAGWLDDFALFRALKTEHNLASWLEWGDDLRLRRTRALNAARKRLAAQIDEECFLQFLFFRQWRALRAYANERDILIVGDIPIFVSPDGADVWANRELFQLGRDGHPKAVAGVPPDYFSATGQLWGNPLYDWKKHASTGYAWWIERLRAVFGLVDITRIDHFRGFAAYWSIPYGDKTAENGTWQPGPGRALFDAARAKLGEHRIIAEDLGLITPDVEQLRRELGLPGMSVLQFAFGSGPHNLYLPHNNERGYVVYTGTHDNNTTAGWWHELDEKTQQHVRTYLRTEANEIHWDFIRAAYATVCETAVVPLQDVLGLGSESRMNRPGSLGGNWSWRFQPGALTEHTATLLGLLADLFGRAAPAREAAQEEAPPEEVETARAA